LLVAAIHRMIGYRAGEAGVTHDAIAGLHRVTADETRAITPPLQARLQLSEQQALVANIRVASWDAWNCWSPSTRTRTPGCRT
jgi:hypothetical protein